MNCKAIYILLGAAICAAHQSNAAATNHSIPSTLLLGLATSAFQIEGGWQDDGKGESMWDRFLHENISRSLDGNNGDIACDSYHKWQEDIQHLKELGAESYRFSISWARILPDGTTRMINQKGIDHYLKFILALKAANIEPLVTLYHWDLPQHLNELGGWLNPQIAEYFGAYARICFKHFGQYVKYWFTMNEPSSTCTIGYGSKEHAPGLPLIGDGAYQCAYTQIIAHAVAYHIYDKEFRKTQNGKVTIVIGSAWNEPFSNSTEDIEATNTEFEFNLGLYANPVYLGNWPQVVINRIANRSKIEGYTFSRLPVFTEEEIEFVKGTADYFAVNLYTSFLVQHSPDVIGDTPNFWLDKGTKTLIDPSWKSSSTSWLNSDPSGMRKLLNYVNNKYKPGEIMVTENGWPDSKSELEDQDRIDYLEGYLSNLVDAIVEDKVNVTGYSVWSLMDNLEWNSGFTQRLGLIYVDVTTENRTRTWKSSAKWYQKVIANRCLVDQCY